MSRLPFNREAEEALLGAMLSGAKVDSDLGPEDSYHGTHGAIYQVIKHGACDPIAAAAELEKQGKLPANGRAYLHGLAEALPVAGNAEHYAQLVRECAQLRGAKRTAYRILEAPEWNGEVTEAVKELGMLVEQGRPQVSTSWTPVELEQFVAGANPEQHPVILPREDGPCLLYEAKLHTIQSGPEAGKTWLALGAAADCLRIGKKVAYFDFEDDAATS
jgi:hypothetical protein